MSNNLKNAQQIMLNILVEFDRICTKHNLVYWLDYGTLLGAVRHQGFIPWDDDLDVSMPREDYIKFLQVAKLELNKKYFLQNKETDKDIFIHFSKIRDMNSLFVEQHETGKNVTYQQGIYIDIFPVNFIASDFITTFTYSFFKKLTKVFSNRYINIESIASLLIKVTNSFHNASHDLVVRGAEKMSEELKMEKSKLFPLDTCLFEDKYFKIPKNVHSYLIDFYGNSYMTPPPKDQQHTHHHTIDVNTNKTLKG